MITTLYFAAAAPVTKSAFAIKALRRLFIYLFILFGNFHFRGKGGGDRIRSSVPVENGKIALLIVNSPDVIICQNKQCSCKPFKK